MKTWEKVILEVKQYTKRESKDRCYSVEWRKNGEDSEYQECKKISECYKYINDLSKKYNIKDIECLAILTYEIEDGEEGERLEEQYFI